MIRRFLFLAAAACLVTATLKGAGAQELSVAEIEKLSKQGRTLSADVTAKFPLAQQRVSHDTGINVLVDLAHQASFFGMWSLPPQLRRDGFRASGSQAALSSVLTPGNEIASIGPHNRQLSAVEY